MPYLKAKDLQAALEISDAEVTPAVTRLLRQSISTASTLMNGYIGWDPSDIGFWREYTLSMEGWERMIQLPYWPVVAVEGINASGEPIYGYEDGNTNDGWWLNKTHGIIEDVVFPTNAIRGGGRHGNRITVIYRAGFEYLPHDLRDVAINLASSIYDSGGVVASPGDGGVGSGELKSLTMFDAMSMSFDTGSTTNKGGAGQMVSTWGFVLDKYKRNGPVLA